MTEDLEEFETTTDAPLEYTKIFDVSTLKNLKKTSQSFLGVNGFRLSEPDFEEMTSDQFVEYFEKNSNPEVMRRLADANFQETFRSTMSNIYTHENGKNKIFVFFLPESELKGGVGLDIVKNFCRLVVLLDCNEGMMISERDLTTRSKELLESSNIKKFSGEDVYNVISYTDESFIDQADHCLNPKVLKIYSGKEVTEFEEQERISSRELPRIFSSDPIAKFYRAKVGDIIKMIRKTGTRNTLINEQLVYRLVVYPTFKK